ncbi:MAG: sporulation integral membrane protein YtvI [Bacillota bacterium]
MKPTYKLGLGILGVILFSMFFFNYLLIYFLPFIIAFVIASLIEPIVQFLCNRLGLARGIAVTICLGIILIIIILLVTIFLSRLFIELNKLANNIPEFSTIGDQAQWVVRQNRNLGRLLQELELPTTVKEVITQNLEKLYQQLRNMIQTGVVTFLNLIKSLPKFLTILLVSLISSFFISRDKELINQSILKVTPQKWHTKVKKLEIEIMNAVIGFLRAQLTLISITTLLTITGLLILDSNYAISMGLLAGLLDLIPIIGPSLVIVPWATYAIIIGEINFGISLLVVLCLVAVVRQLAEAKIIGENIGIHPLATLIAMYLGVQLLGVMGFFIGPAILILLRAVFRAGFISFFN